MSAIFEAHLRMLATLPVRTHERRVRHEPTPLRNLQNRRERVRELLETGTPRRRFHLILKCSRTAIQKHLRAIKRGK